MATATEPSAPQSPVVQQGSGSRGCLYGCLAIIVGGLLLLVCSGVGVYWFVKGQIEKWTSTEPGNIPTVEYSDEQLAELKGRVDAFSEAMDEGRTPEEDLVLTAEEINALISSDETMRGKVFITIEDGEVSGDVSFPLDDIGIEGRYFNGSASLSVSMENGILIVRLTDASVNGEQVPEEIVKEIGKDNLAKEMYNDVETAETLSRIESVKVEGDKIILTFKRTEEDGEADATEESVSEASEGSSEPETGETEVEATESDEATAEASTESGTEAGVSEESETASEEASSEGETETENAESEGSEEGNPGILQPVG